MSMTSWAGRLAIRPCRVSSIVDSSPMLLRKRSVPGWPFHSRPQRQSHSLNPSSQPRPPRLFRLMRLGCTRSLTGESQPSTRVPSMSTERMPMPRVGMTPIWSLPLSIQITSICSCFPPKWRYFRTDQGVGHSGAA